jgi:hypothetical protein
LDFLQPRRRQPRVWVGKAAQDEAFVVLYILDLTDSFRAMVRGVLGLIAATHRVSLQVPRLFLKCSKRTDETSIELLYSVINFF